MVTLRTVLALNAIDAAVQELNATLRFHRIHRDQAGDLIVRQPLSLQGRVRAEWLAQALGQWTAGCKDAERILKRKRRPIQAGTVARPTRSVH